MRFHFPIYKFTHYLWNGVVTGAAPRVATQDTFDAEPCALEDAVLHHRLDHILAARGRIAARRRRKRRDTIAVEIDRQQEYLTKEALHFQLTVKN